MQWNETGCEKTNEYRHQGIIERKGCFYSTYTDDSNRFAFRF